MKLARLIHNPGAGDEEHSKNYLLELLTSNGMECSYFSTKKKGWDELEKDTELLIIAGGDGTVRKVAGELLERKLIDKKIPLALLPMGTANNIAKTLGIEGDEEAVIRSWCEGHKKKFDVGRVEGLEETHFILEGFGYGIFPKLMREMKKVDKETIDEPEKKMKKALQLLHDIILHMEPFYCGIEADGVHYSGKYLVAEIMNINSIGPNLQLAPTADPGDGELELVLINEDKRQELADYVLNKLNGTNDPSMFQTIKAKQVQFDCNELLLHADDKLIKQENAATIIVEVQEGRLEFLVPVPVVQRVTM